MKADTKDEALREHRSECEAAISAFKRELSKMRTGRASAAMVEGVIVDCYGAKTALEHLAQVSTPEPSLISIQAYDANVAPAIEKAIHAANLGLNPSREGNIIRVMVPQLTEESRRDVVKHLHKLAEDIRISIRNHRRDANECLKAMEKNSKLDKDGCKKALDEIQKQTDSFIGEVDVLLRAKEAECMEV